MTLVIEQNKKVCSDFEKLISDKIDKNENVNKKNSRLNVRV